MVPPKPSYGAMAPDRELKMLARTKEELDRERTRSSRLQIDRGRHYTQHAGPPGDIDFLSSNRDPDEFSKLSPIDPGGFSEFFVKECMSLLDRKGSEFHDFMLEAGRLEAYVSNSCSASV
jgi:hypothetical protein